MHPLLIIFLIVFMPAALIAYLSYNKMKKAGKNPWFWTIFSFIVAAGLVFGALWLFFTLTWQR